MTGRSQGIEQHRGEEEPADKKRAQTVHKPDRTDSREATRDPKLNDDEKTPGSGTTPNDKGDPPTG